jgi:hypothetical protein
VKDHQNQVKEIDRSILIFLAGLLLLSTVAWAVFSDHDIDLLVAGLVIMIIIFFLGPFWHYLHQRKDPDFDYSGYVGW